MSACSTWREQLTDYALGLPASGALLAHVASCASCSTALADWRARIQQLDAGVRQLVSSEPPPYLPSRVVAGINSRPPLYVRLQRWKTVMATIVFVVIVAVFESVE